MTYTHAIPVNPRWVKRAHANGGTYRVMHCPRWLCPVPGCTSTMCDEGTTLKHANRTHVACRCGWVGVSLPHHISHHMTVVCADAGVLTIDTDPVDVWAPPSLRASALLASPFA